jgi:zinc protease
MDMRLGFFPRHLLAVCLALTLGSMLSVSLEARVRPPKLEYRYLTLPNGLQVVLHEDHSTPIVNLQLWYHVGSKDEKTGRTGFAHLFEHMMFQGSKNVTREQHNSMIASVGGDSNAYTTEDATVFWETVPSQYLPLILWLEADRMATLNVDQENFLRERSVVKEERRQRIENQPYGNLQEIVYDHAFTVHPYKHMVVGSMADLDAASLKDVQEFHATYYVPANAVAVLTGDFDGQQALDLIQRYLGRVPKATKAIKRDIPEEPKQTTERRATVEEGVPLPAVVVAYHITYDGHPDSYPLHIASKVLSDGQSSRIYSTLVYEKRIALAAFGGGNLIENPNLFFATAIVQPGHTPEEVEKALIAELDRLRSEPISEHELERTKNQFARDYILGRQTIKDKGDVLGHAAVIHHGDLGTADGEFDIFMNVKASDVQRVAQTYFIPENRLVMHIMPRGQAGAATGGAR